MIPLRLSMAWHLFYFLKYWIFHFLDRPGCLFIHSLLEHIGGFEVRAVMNRATINIHQHGVGWAQVFSLFVKTRRYAAAESHADALVLPVICSLFSTQAGPLCFLSKQWGTVSAPHSSLPSLAARVLDFGLSDKDITLPLHSFNFCLFACFLQVWELNPGSHTRSATFHHWPSCFFCSFAVPRWQLILHSSPVNLLFRPSLLNYHSRLAVLRSHVYFR